MTISTIPAGAILYQQAASNPIGVTAATSTNIGYLTTNKSQLEAVGQLTGQDATDMYNFTYQNSGPVTFSFKNLDGTAPARVQLLDGSGSRVLADNQGTTAQKQAYAQLTSNSGLDLGNGKYIVKVSYGAGGSKSQKQDYTFQINSGTTYKNDYRTLASASTIQNTLLAGGSTGYNPLTAAASLLTDESNGTSVNIFGTLQLFATNIFA